MQYPEKNLIPAKLQSNPIRKILLIKLLIIAVILSLANRSVAQDLPPSPVPQVIPPSPQMASLGKYGDILV